MNEYQTQTGQYNVLYKKLGKSDRSAMPLGNGKTGISLWVEEDGDLQFYIGHSDAQSEIDRNLKLGKVILKLDPNPFVRGAVFSQELVLLDGCVEIRVENSGKKIVIKVFVDAGNDVIYVDVQSENPIKARAHLFCWRTGEKAPWKVSNEEMRTGSVEESETADVVFSRQDGIVFYHRNGRTCVESTCSIEGLSAYKDAIVDTLENRIFGGYLTLYGGTAVDNGLFTESDVKTHHLLKTSVFCEQTPNTDNLLNRVIALHELDDFDAAKKRTSEYWDKYFGQSYIFVKGDKEVTAPVPEDIAALCLEPQDPFTAPSKVTQSYLLTKYMFACSSKGELPIHFNGMIFNLMPGLHKHFNFEEFCKIFSAQPTSQPDLEINPDEKAWENCINLWQNVRLPYFAMLARGEFDAVKVLFAYYRKFWAINRVRAQLYYHADGQFNTEMTHSFGLQPMSVYGSDRTGLPDGYATNRWGGAIDISPGLELCFMMLEYFNYTRDVRFLAEEMLPYAEELFHYIETRFTQRKAGKIHMTNLNAVETYFDTTNPTPVVAGMHAVVKEILSLSPELVPNRSFFEKQEAILPEIPLEKDDCGNVVIAPAEVYMKDRKNVECPDLYPIFPFRLFTREKGDQVLIKNTFRHSMKVSGCFQPHKHGWSVTTGCYSGWQYVGMVAALMGMDKETEEILVNNCSLKNPGTRFPAMWGPTYDSVPDGDHAANLTNTLQLMAMQSDGDKIFVLPAWPVNWDVKFKLYAGNNTIVSCEYIGGKIVSLSVNPQERMKDVLSKHFQLNRRSL